MQCLGSTPCVDGEILVGSFSILQSGLLLVFNKHGRTLVRKLTFNTASAGFGGQSPAMYQIKAIERTTVACDLDVKERQIVFLDEGGLLAIYRLNESFSSMEVMRAVSHLALKASIDFPSAMISVSNGVVIMSDRHGATQTLNCRSQRLSRLAVLSKSDDVVWTSPLYPQMDGIALVRVVIVKKSDESLEGHVQGFSVEDGHELPSSASLPLSIRKVDTLSSQAFGDNILVFDAETSCILLVKVTTTMRSDSFRMQSTAATHQDTSSAGSVSAESGSARRQCSSHWLWVFYHLYEKFPVRGLLQGVSTSPAEPLSVHLVVESTEAKINSAMSFFSSVMTQLEKLQKPLHGLDLTRELHVFTFDRLRGVEDFSGSFGREFDSSVFLQTLITFVPIQLCRAEFNMLTVMENGHDTSAQALGETQSLQSADIARSIRFGLYSPLLASWPGRCVVITSMGKQSTGKSYFLNHLTGSSFAISGERCTDGAWISVVILPKNVLLVVIDFEGLGSFERTEQEDVFLSVLNASISMLTIFRMEMRFDKEIDDLFNKFQKGSQLLKGDQLLFRGKLYMSIKDVNPNDQRGIIQEFETKLSRLLASNREHNFLTEMYSGQLDINCSPPLGTPGYYRSLVHVQRYIERALCSPSSSAGFRTGKSFLDCMRLVLAKISILDWTSLDESALQLRLSEAMEELPMALRFGCLIRASTDFEDTTAHREDLIDYSTAKRIDVRFEEVCAAFPQMATRWQDLRCKRLEFHQIVQDHEVDLGDGVNYGIECDRRVAAASETMKILFGLFKQWFPVAGRLSVEMQREFDAFLSFLLRRRRLRIQRWARSRFGGQLPEPWTVAELQQCGAAQNLFVRCLDRCEQCELGCMKASAHGSGEGHDCGTTHKCVGLCDYCGQVNPGMSHVCSKKAGHEGKCECADGDHTCGAPCALQKASNCGQSCAAKTNHVGEHRCSVGMHKCGKPCGSSSCGRRCVVDFEARHDRHECELDRCLHGCKVDGCDRLCSSTDHFHGHDENGDAPVAHICAEEHACQALCEEDGVCHVDVFLKKSSKTFKGKRGTFQYTYQEMNGSRRKCVMTIPRGQEVHDGPHSCVEKAEESGVHELRHYCDVRCPCCLYYCQKEHGHGGNHKTTHGNMRNTYFLSDDPEIDIGERKYVAGEQGTAEMCNMYCAKMGRGPVYVSRSARGVWQVRFQVRRARSRHGEALAVRVASMACAREAAGKRLRWVFVRVRAPV
ncbi:hypothetical protein PINS_up022924 [Pythium insidiosum]|nr:hypothetical protein PINS_up022924 [Pythium insidiosum]